MKKTKFKNLASSLYKKERFIITALLVVIITSMSVGYAAYYEELKLEGQLIVESLDEFLIYKHEISDSNNATSKSISYTTTESNGVSKLEINTTINFSSNIWAGKDLHLTYKFQVANFTDKKLTFADVEHSAQVGSRWQNIGAPVVTGIAVGDVLQPGDIIDVYVQFYMDGSISFSKDVTIDCDLIFNEGDVDIKPGSLQTSIDSTTLNLDNNNMAKVDVSILSLYKTSVDYTITSSNNNVTLVDEDGNPFTYTNFLDAGATDDITLYLKVKDGVDLSSDITTTLRAELTDTSTYSFGSVVLTKDTDPKWYDYSLTYTIKSEATWADHYNVIFKITNNGDETMDQYTAYVYLNDSLVVNEFYNYQSMVVFDPAENLVKLSSKQRWSDAHNSIAPGESFEFTVTVFGMNKTDLIIDKIFVRQEGEVYTEGWNYSTLT